MLDGTFRAIEGHQYQGMDLKPYLRNDAQYLAPDQVKQERSAKAAIFASVKEVRQKPEFRMILSQTSSDAFTVV